MFCANCGRAVAQTDTFCASCGQAVQPGAIDAAVTTPPLQYGTPPPPAPPAPGMQQPPPPGFAVGVGRDLDPVTGRPLAGWGKRVGAYLLDAVILGIPLVIVWVIIIAASNSTTGQVICNNSFSCHYTTVFHPGTFWPATIVIYLVPVAYFTLLLGRKRGQTLGMMAIGIAVRDAATDSPIGFGRALLRYFIIFVLSLAFGIPLLIDFLSPLWDRRQQAWHDHAASSLVVAVR
jgi:uncharacterized RDD family membrane protein YckC